MLQQVKYPLHLRALIFVYVIMYTEKFLLGDQLNRLGPLLECLYVLITLVLPNRIGSINNDLPYQFRLHGC